LKYQRTMPRGLFSTAFELLRIHLGLAGGNVDGSVETACFWNVHGKKKKTCRLDTWRCGQDEPGRQGPDSRGLNFVWSVLLVF
jgi:hypothetical protein